MPQLCGPQVSLHSSSLMRFPSSHDSTPTRMMPSPHTASRQFDRHPSGRFGCHRRIPQPLWTTPSPHSEAARVSAPIGFNAIAVIAASKPSRIPSTHRIRSQLLRQPSELTGFRRRRLRPRLNHAVTTDGIHAVTQAGIAVVSVSVIALFDPGLDQTVTTQGSPHVTVQSSSLRSFPSSQASNPGTTPSPQTAERQLLRQSSPSISLPSSHSSTPSRTRPSPHRARIQLLRHASLSLALPSSHSSTPP